MNRISLLFSFLLFWTSLIASPAYTLSGTISDAATGETMIGASITLKELPGKGTTTNSYGYYSLSLPAGKYTVVVSYLGYNALTQNIDLSSSKRMDFRLEPASQVLKDVEISAVRKNNNITSSQMGMEKLEAKEMLKVPVIFGEADIMKTLKLTPGVKSVGEGNGGFYVRGGNSSQNLVLLDEATVYNADHLLGFFSTFNSDAIKDVQMYKGTAPAEYGGRTSSVLDVKMNDGNNQKYHVGGGIGLISSRLNVEGPLVKDKGSVLVTARRTYADLFLKLSSDPMINNNQLYFYDLNVKANYIVNENNRIYLSGYFGRDVFDFQNRFGIDWGNKTGTLRWNRIWNGRLFSNTSLIYSDYSYNININDSTNYGLKSVIRTWNLKHEFQYKPNTANSMVFGFQSQYHTITPGQLEISDTTTARPVTLQNKFVLENALFAGNTWTPNSHFNINYGLRFSMFHLFGPGDFYTFDNGELSSTSSYQSGQVVKSYFNLEPRVNMAWIIDDRNSVKAGYSRNTQNLHLISNSTSSLPTDIWIPSGLNVKPEIGDQVSLGYFMNFADDRYQLSAETYYRWMQNQIDLKNGANIYANEYIEGELLYGVGRAYGLELLLKKKYGKLTGWVGYTYSRTERKIDGINDGNWYPAKQDITHDVSVVAIYDLSKKWSLSASWVFNTGNAVTFPSGKYIIDGSVQYYYTERNGYRMPDYHRLDLGATWNLKKRKMTESSLNFSVYNAYGHKNAYSIDFEQDENNPNQINAVMTYLFTFVPSVTYNFKF